MAADGDSVGIVSGVYLAILLPWAFLYYHDFISSRWTSIRTTYRNGLIHVVVISLPMPYIIYYIYLQPSLSEPDYKEMYAAITALVLSFYHLLRTVWGLLQLRHFRRWAIATARALESASYQCDTRLPEKPDKPPKIPNPSVSLLARLTDRLDRFHRTPRDAASSTTLSTSHSLKNPRPPPPPPPPPATAARPLSDTARIHAAVDAMLINSSVVDNEFIASSAPWVSIVGLRMHPTHPVHTFVRWSVAYLSQFGRQWLSDSSASHFDSATWTGRRHRLASEVWATAALRMEASCSEPAAAPNVASSSFLQPDVWSTLMPRCHDQIFRKENVLRRCYASGDGLPYGHPVLAHRDDPPPSHALFRPLIKDAVAHLPSHLYDGIDVLSPEQLEWFAIFLWIKHWGGCHPDAAERTLGRNTPLSPSDTPVRLLQDQLGLDEPPSLHQCAFPFMKRGYGRYLWDNRSILQVSARIDNWVSLCVGHQVAFLLENNRALKVGGDAFRLAHADTAELEDAKKNGKMKIELPPSRSERIFEFHRTLEIKRLRYQLADYYTRHAHLEQGLTFMGCVVESVRSGIAERLYWDLDGHSTSWSPEIPRGTVTIDISMQLWRCLKHAAVGDTDAPFDSTVQERLLWECQNGIYYKFVKRLQADRPGGAQRTAEAMILCVLGFPSIHIEHSQLLLMAEGISQARTLFKIWPTAGPQPLKVYATVSASEALLGLRLSPEESETHTGDRVMKFRWQDWRDAFEGRLRGKSEWQRSHFMRELQVHHTIEPIWEGIRSLDIGDDGDRKGQVWEGWKPFRAGMTLFELKHSSLIVFEGKMPADLHQPITSPDATPPGQIRMNTVSRGVRAYKRANAEDLSDASLHLDALLKLSSSLFKTQPEPGSPPEGSPPHSRNLLLPYSIREDMDTDEEDEPQVVGLSPDSSPDSSDGGFGVTMTWNLNPMLPHHVLAKAQEQDPVAMHELAKWVLTGTKGFKKNRTKALLLMERAIVLGRRIETARLFVKTILEYNANHLHANTSKLDRDVARALKNVELLWRDMETRHKKVTVNGQERQVWKTDDLHGIQKENQRLSSLKRLHLKLVNVRRTAEMMRNLADRLSIWGKSGEDADMAIVLYESAIMANCDLEAMVELAPKYATRDISFAVHLCARAEATTEQRWADIVKEYAMTSREMDFGKFPDVRSTYEARAKRGDLGAMKLLQALKKKSSEEVIQYYQVYHDLEGVSSTPSLCTPLPNAGATREG